MANHWVDPRNGRHIVRAANGKVRYSLPPDATDDEIAAAMVQADREAAFLRGEVYDSTLDGFSEWYLRGLRNANGKPSTLKTYRHVYRRHVSPRIGKERAAKVTPNMVSDLLAAIVAGAHADPVSPKTANLCRSYLHAVYERAVLHGYLNSNPVKFVKRLNVGVQEPVMVFDAVERDIIKAWAEEPCDDWEGRCARRAVLLALETGMRVGEICALRWRSFDFDRLAVHVTGTMSEAEGIEIVPTKSNSNRSFAISENLALEVAAWFGDVRSRIPGCDLLFPTEDGGYRRPYTLSKQFKTACWELGLGDGRNFHQLRHTNATYMLDKGVSPKAAIDRTGHSDAAFFLKTYGHVIDLQDRRAADVLGDMHAGIYPRKEGGAPYGG